MAVLGHAFFNSRSRTSRLAEEDRFMQAALRKEFILPERIADSEIRA